MFDENSIVDRILSGDESAFVRLIDRYEHSVYQYALHFLGHETDACAATEEIFVQIYRKLGARTDIQLSTWIFRITANVCAEYQHRKRGAKSTMAVFRMRAKTEKSHDLTKEVQVQLLRLTRQQREILLLRDLCGMNDAETAKVLDLDGNSIRLRLSRARKNLRDLLLRQNALKQPERNTGMSKECQHFRELCSRYVDECISENQKTELLDHIQECTFCAAYLNDLTNIGRCLAHMAEGELPEGLHDKLTAAVEREAENAQAVRRNGYYTPMIIVVGIAVLFLILAGTGILGGMFVNSSYVTVPENAYGTGSGQQHTALAKNIRVPDAVSANSYAFVIAAAGDTDLPELSTSATLLAGDRGDGVAYYSVDDDFNLVQKLTDGLEAVGYEMETVTNEQIVISSSAPQGLFIIIHEKNRR